MACLVVHKYILIDLPIYLATHSHSHIGPNPGGFTLLGAMNTLIVVAIRRECLCLLSAWMNNETV
jgi:hypothetical protein